MLVKEAKQACGSDLGKASKMPGFGYGLSALNCKTGSKLAKIKGSICSDCYALGGNYMYPSVALSHERRIKAIKKDLNAWMGGMIALISKRVDPEVPYFRWHDSGDLDSVDHLKAIVAIAEYLPNVSFWLPTKEKGFLLTFIAQGGKIPKNLAIRLSASMQNQKSKLPKRLKLASVQASQGFAKPDMGAKETCPASLQDDKCLDCRKCWDKSLPTVTYKLH